MAFSISLSSRIALTTPISVNCEEYPCAPARTWVQHARGPFLSPNTCWPNGPTAVLPAKRKNGAARELFVNPRVLLTAM